MTFWFPKPTMFLGTLGDVMDVLLKKIIKQKTLFSGHIHLGKDVYSAPVLGHNAH